MIRPVINRRVKAGRGKWGVRSFWESSPTSRLSYPFAFHNASSIENNGTLIDSPSSYTGSWHELPFRRISSQSFCKASLMIYIFFRHKIKFCKWKLFTCRAQLVSIIFYNESKCLVVNIFPYSLRKLRLWKNYISTKQVASLFWVENFNRQSFILFPLCLVWNSVTQNATAEESCAAAYFILLAAVYFRGTRAANLEQICMSSARKCTSSKLAAASNNEESSLELNFRSACFSHWIWIIWWELVILSKLDRFWFSIT